MKAFTAAVRTLPLLAVSILFVSIYSWTTGPISSGYGFDSAIFRHVGFSLTQGMVPYIDFWDHKGPALFLIQWLAQTIVEGRVGIFILQILFLFGSLYFLDNMSRRWLSVTMRSAVILTVLAFLTSVYEGGNLTEEYTLFFSFLVLNLLTREWTTGKTLNLVWYGLCGGVFAFVALIRLNNTATILATFLAVFTIALINHRSIWKPLLASFAGFLVVTGAICAWLASQGALAEMWNAAFVHNLVYATGAAPGAGAFPALVFQLIGGAVIFVGLLGGIFYWQRTGRIDFLVLSWCNAAITAVAAFFHVNGYLHYLQLAIPALALGAIFILETVEKKAKILALIAVIAFAGPLLGGHAKAIFTSQLPAAEARYYDEVQSVLTAVPAKERADVYAYGMLPKYFVITKAIHPQRYFFSQDALAALSPEIESEISSFILEDQPKWIITPNHSGGPSTIPSISQIFKDNYSAAKTTRGFVLYELKED